MYKNMVLDKTELEARYYRMKPIVEINGKKYFLRKFTYDELKNRTLLEDIEADKDRVVDCEVYQTLIGRDFDCHHSFGSKGKFKPTIAEILAQIPQRDICIVSAFEILDVPSNSEEYFENERNCGIGFYVSKVRLYYRKRYLG